MQIELSDYVAIVYYLSKAGKQSWSQEDARQLQIEPYFTGRDMSALLSGTTVNVNYLVRRDSNDFRETPTKIFEILRECSVCTAFAGKANYLLSIPDEHAPRVMWWIGLRQLNAKLYDGSRSVVGVCLEHLIDTGELVETPRHEKCSRTAIDVKGSVGGASRQFTYKDDNGVNVVVNNKLFVEWDDVFDEQVRPLGEVAMRVFAKLQENRIVQRFTNLYGFPFQISARVVSDWYSSEESKLKGQDTVIRDSASCPDSGLLVGHSGDSQPLATAG